ncbi:MAG: hypothetical protein ACPGVG_07365 [Mycobacterium sp.]
MPTANLQPPTEAVAAFENNIWPAVALYNLHQMQGDVGSVAFNKIVDPSLDAPAWGAVRDAIQKLGTIREDPPGMVEVGPDGRLSLASADLTGGDAANATLQICYTYTASDRFGKNRVHAASEATVELRKTDTWYLHAITNDHVVPDCSGSSKT